MSNPMISGSSDANPPPPGGFGLPPLGAGPRPPGGWLRWPVILLTCLFAAAGGAAATWFVCHWPAVRQHLEEDDEEDEDYDGYDDEEDDGNA
jgi:hypothetical protein